MRGQASTEFLVTIGIIFAFTVPILFLMFTVSELGYEDTARAQADASARSLAETLNFVYSQGDGAKRVILLNTPPSTREVVVASGEVSVVMTIGDGTYEGVAPTFASVYPDPKTLDKSGLFFVVVTNDGGQVTVEGVG